MFWPYICECQFCSIVNFSVKRLGTVFSDIGQLTFTIFNKENTFQKIPERVSL